jgi:hypothetical protein
MKDIETTTTIGCNDVSVTELVTGYQKLFKEIDKISKLWDRWRVKIPCTPEVREFIEFLKRSQTFHHYVLRKQTEIYNDIIRNRSQT